jgi:serine protease Do
MSDFAGVVELLSRSTVEVTSPDGGGGGSGVVWRPGVVITNAHVARGARARVRLWDRTEIDASVVARDRGRDLAALDVPAGGGTPVSLRDPGSLRVGELVVAMGHPLGVRGAVAIGIIHALGPPDAPPHRRWIRADVRLAPGNSGGPLADASGRLVGVNTMVAHGLALAIPGSAVERFLQDGGRRPYIGVATRALEVRGAAEGEASEKNPKMTDRERRNPEVEVRGAAEGEPSEKNPKITDRESRHPEGVAGLLVIEILPDSPAAAAGLQIGDMLLHAGGKRLDAPDALARVVQDAVPGNTVVVDLARLGQRLTREVTVGAA